MNVRLLRKVQQQILRKPEAFNMRRWLVAKVKSKLPGRLKRFVQSDPTDCYYQFDERQVYDQFRELQPSLDNECGTMGCICGWAISLAEREDIENALKATEQYYIDNPNDIDHTRIGAHLLGVPVSDARSLFFLHERENLGKPGTLEYAQKCSRAIDQFINQHSESPH